MKIEQAAEKVHTIPASPLALDVKFTSKTMISRWIATVAGRVSWVVLASLACTPAVAIDRDLQAAISASPDDVAAKVKVDNDPMETFIEVDTEPFYQQKQGLLRIVSADKFMRALIDKKTGATTFQLYVWTHYGGDVTMINRANLETADGPLPATLHQVRNTVESCSRYGCTQRVDVAVDVPEAVVRWVARDARAGSNEDWKVHLSADNGEAGNTEILKTEVAGLLKVVDAQRANLHAK